MSARINTEKDGRTGGWLSRVLSFFQKNTSNGDAENDGEKTDDMLHRIFRDILMFSGIYEHVEDGGLSVLLLFGLLSIGMISVFSRPTIVRMWNRLLALYTPQWLCRIRSANV